MLKKIQIFTLLFTTALLTGCIDPIDFTGEGGEPLLVIFGGLKIGEQQSELVIRYTQPTGGPGDNVTDAVVLLRIGDGAEAQMLPDAEGVYRFEPTDDFPLERGQSYTTEITLTNGEIYVTDPQTMPAPPPPARGFISIVSRAVDVFARTDFSETDEAQFIRVGSDNVYSFPEITCGPFDPAFTCYFERDVPLRSMPLFDNDGGTIRDSLTSKMFTLTKISGLQGGFWGKHYYNLYLHSISAETYAYWEKVNKISNAQGSIFDPTPAVIPGNIYEKGNPDKHILGYFEVAQVSVVRPSVTLADYINAGLFLAPYCPTTNIVIGNFDPACCDCTRLEGASLDKPDWF